MTESYFFYTNLPNDKLVRNLLLNHLCKPEQKRPVLSSNFVSVVTIREINKIKSIKTNKYSFLRMVSGRKNKIA